MSSALEAALRAPQPGAEVLSEPLRSRWSPSVYDDAHTLTRAEIDQLLSAARWAPSAGNSQPWVFFVCERGSANHDRLVAQLSRGNSGWVPRASVVFVTAAHVSTGADEDAPAYSDYALYDVGQAAAHLTLQARAMGLHAHQFAGFDHDALAEDLGLPATHVLLTGIAVGRRATPPTWTSAPPPATTGSASAWASTRSPGRARGRSPGREGLPLQSAC